jgi:hypothetical protein
VNLPDSMAGQIHYLNYPRAMPKFVDFSQHLIAPLGNVISIELQNVQFDQSSCEDNATIEVRARRTLNFHHRIIRNSKDNE